MIESIHEINKIHDVYNTNSLRYTTPRDKSVLFQKSEV